MHCFRPRTAAVRLLPALLLASLPLQAADLPSPASSPLLATDPAPVFGQASSGVLPADQAFMLGALVEPDNAIVLFWDIHSNHYLYRDSLKFTTADGGALAPDFPPASEVTDEFFGTVPVYFERLQLTLPASATGARAGGTTTLLLEYQGCAKDLYCYPPQQKTVTLSFPD